MNRSTRTVLAALALAPALALEAQRPPARRAPTLADATAYIDAAERELAARVVPVSQASWVAANFITDDTEALSAWFQTDFALAVRPPPTRAPRVAPRSAPAAP